MESPGIARTPLERAPMEKRQFLPLSTGQVLDEAFRLYRAHFVRLITIAAIGQIPISLLVMSGIIPVELHGLVSFPAGLMLAACLQRAASEFYLGGDISVGEVYRFILRRIFRVMCAAVLYTMLVVLGCACIAPGVLFAGWFCLMTSLVVVEGLTTRQAIWRSKELVSGNFSKAIVVIIGSFVVSWIIQALFTGLGLGAAYLLMGRERAFEEGGFVLVQQFAQSIGQVLQAPFIAGALIMLYYDLRIRKEGFDLEMLAREMAGEMEGLPDGTAATQ